MKIINKGKNIYFFLIIGVVLISFLIFRETKSPAQENSKVDTLGWKTYQNEEYGFELQYPTNWEFRQGPLPNVFLFGEGGPTNQMVNVTVEPAPYQNKDYPEDWICTEVRVNSLEAMRCEGVSVVETVRGVQGPLVYKTVVVRIEYQGKVYVVSLSRDPNKTEQFEMFDSVISSLRLY